MRWWTEKCLTLKDKLDGCEFLQCTLLSKTFVWKFYSEPFLQLSLLSPFCRNGMEILLLVNEKSESTKCISNESFLNDFNCYVSLEAAGLRENEVTKVSVFLLCTQLVFGHVPIFLKYGQVIIELMSIIYYSNFVVFQGRVVRSMFSADPIIQPNQWLALTMLRTTLPRCSSAQVSELLESSTGWACVIDKLNYLRSFKHINIWKTLVERFPNFEIT